MSLIILEIGMFILVYIHNVPPIFIRYFAALWGVGRRTTWSGYFRVLGGHRKPELQSQ